MHDVWNKSTRRESLMDQYSGRIGSIVPRHRAELALIAAKNDAETANRAKSEFLAHISHELRTPLNAIIGFSDIIRQNLLGTGALDRYRDYAGDIFSSGEHLLSIINDILDLTKHDVGRVELDCEIIDLASVIDECVSLLRESANSQNLSLNLNVDDNLPPLFADRKRIKQILINLASNAVKFTPEGGIVTISAKINDSGKLVIKVTDNGVGMEPQEIPIALEPFRQVEHYLTRQHDGTGLGLPIAKAFSDLHGAKFQMISEQGKGTEVSLEFPKERLEVQSVETESQNTAKRNAARILKAMPESKIIN